MGGFDGDRVERHLPETTWRWIWVVCFAIAFAWVESSVVVYLWEIYYGGLFNFPIIIEWDGGKVVTDKLMRIEFGREIATMIMLISVGWAGGRNAVQRFCLFMIGFGVWDLFYYIWLWVMVGWPESLMTWDLLFLLPLPWVGPVIAPTLIAMTMLVVGSLMLFYDGIGRLIQFRWYDWVVEFGCAFFIISSFCWDWKNIIRLPDGLPRSGLPSPFAWWLFLPPYVFSVIYFWVRFKKTISFRRP
jgi:hypothetical protein